MKHRRPWLVSLVLAVVALGAPGGCRRSNQIVVPNRVLDRPQDVALACIRRRADGEVEALSLDSCAASTTVACDTAPPPPSAGMGSSSDTTQTANQLIGFVANSERDEVAMFRRCDTEAALVDLDPQAPGYNFVPVGQLPSRIDTTNLGCEVVTANAGSCDLSMIDGRSLAYYAVDLVPDVSPSQLVSTVVPRLVDGEPLGSRTGDMMTVPPRLSLSGPSVGPGGGGTGGSGDTGGTGGVGGTPRAPVTSACALRGGR